MTFLQPFVLWGLPLILVPVLIHLFNRLRHRSMPWAAMMFLRTATRKSTRYARLRQFLILLFRVLAIAGLVFAVSRPLAGGWLGWALAAAPDAILVVLDRSASMEGKAAPGAQESKRQEAVKLMAQSAKPFERGSRVVLLESVFRAPQDVPAAALTELPWTTATATRADLPGLMQAALDWLVENRPGTAEIWIASDLQRSSWDPESDRWPALVGGFSQLPQAVRLRLLALNREVEGNHSVAVLSADVANPQGHAELELALELERASASAAVVPMKVVLNGVPAQVDLKWESQSLRYRHRVPLSSENATGWGYVELPADVNLLDNRSYFVYGLQPVLRAVVVGKEGGSGRILQLATAPDPQETNQVCQLVSPEVATTIRWSEVAVVLWQAALPEGAAAEALAAFVADGGIAVFFPGGTSGSFQGLGWGGVQEAAGEETYRVTHWDEDDGPLAKTEEGLSLPLGDLQVRRRQGILGEKAVLAAFEDGAPFLARQVLGKGQVLFCASLPEEEWSDLSEGAVLVPMLQRLLKSGGRRFTARAALECGEWSEAGTEARWVPLDTAEPRDVRTQAGIYRSGARLVAVNRPAQEDDPEVLEAEKVKKLFGELNVRLFEERGQGGSKLQSELWRLFLLGMAVFLLVEAILILPEKPARAAPGAGWGREEPSTARSRAERETAWSEVS